MSTVHITLSLEELARVTTVLRHVVDTLPNTSTAINLSYIIRKMERSVQHEQTL